MTPRTTRLVFAAGLGAWLINAAIQWGTAPPLGHDEAQYAIAARDLLDGAPVRWSYLSTGMDVVALPGVLAGGSELALRLVPTLLGLAFLLVAAHLARRCFGAATAAWTTVILAATSAVAKRATELLSDLPAATFLLAGVAILVGELARTRRDDPGAGEGPSGSTAGADARGSAATTTDAATTGAAATTAHARRIGDLAPAAGAHARGAGGAHTRRTGDLAPAAGTHARGAGGAAAGDRPADPRLRLLLAAPCFAAAFYLRYGSALAIAAIGVVAIVAAPRAVIRRPWLVVGTVALFVVLLVPHFRTALAHTGSALGFLRDSSTVLGDAYLGRALVVYTTSNPFLYYGIVTAPVLVAGLLAIHRWRDARVRLLWGFAVAGAIAVGLTPIAQARYLFFEIALLVMLGTDELRRWLAPRAPRIRRAAAIAAVALAAASWLLIAYVSLRLDAARRTRWAATLEAIAAIRADTAGAPCQVIGRHSTQLQWYSGCVSVYDAPPETLAAARAYLVYEPGRTHQPDPAAHHPGRARTLIDRPGVLLLLRFDP